MKITGCIFLTFCMLMTSVSESFAGKGAQAATPNARLMEQFWNAWWITHPTASTVEYGVYHFRKDFSLDSVPDTFVVNVSADNRYKFFVNGTEVCLGPARGDLAHWYFETIDIAPYLQSGTNTLAAVVWNHSTHRPWSQFSLQTAFLLQGNTPDEEIVNTDRSWKVVRNIAYTPITNFSYLQTFIVVGPGDRVDAITYPWGWQQNDFDDSFWDNARQLVNAKPRGISTDIDWVMTPRDIPLLENKKETMQFVRRVSGAEMDASRMLKGENTIIPANQKVSILIDNGYLTKGYPVLTLSGGRNSNITLTYAEALSTVDAANPAVPRTKQHRDSIEGMHIRGVYDIFIADGGALRTFSPLWYRTFRYLQLDIETGAEPLTIHDIHNVFSAYPFEDNAGFITSQPLYDKIWEVGWRTARLCAHETYYDCPYYEQLQYVGDTRIQALVSLYVSGDDRLMKKALHMFDASRIYEGITQSRYPSYSPQFIPTYSLVWINMVHDFYMLVQDEAFIESYYTGIKNILNWYEQYIDPSTGLLGKVPYWNFVDWADEWPWDPDQRAGGVPAGGVSGQSSILTLQLAYTLTEAANLMDHYGDFVMAGKYREKAEKLNAAVMKHTWSDEKGLIADTPDKTIFSQHAGIMGILSGAIADETAMDVMDKLLADESLIQATIYFRFYLFLAMIKTGNGDMLLQQLGQWEDMLNLGLTTFAEKPEPTRSDCHAWSASPLYFFLSSVAGIMPAEPGFRSVVIEPRPGKLSTFNATMPHPSGPIVVDADNLNSEYGVFEITLPGELSGRLIWKNKGYSIRPGVNTIQTR